MSEGMIKCTLPEESEEFDAAFHGMDWKLVVWDLQEYLIRELNNTVEEDREYAALKGVLDELVLELEMKKLVLD